MAEQHDPRVDEYILGFDPAVQDILHSVRKTIRAAAPEAEEGISYGMPAYKLHGALVYFAAWKNHIGFYPAGPLSGFEEALAGYRQTKGAIQFPYGRTIPIELIHSITTQRAEENKQRAALKKR